MRQDAAETLALQALAWLATDQDLLQGFLAATGAVPADLRQSAADPTFLGSVLDHLMQEDRWLIAFCDAVGQPYTAPMAARAALPGGAQWHWT